MEFQVPCACGQAVTVTEEVAGSTVPCRCGRPVEVPSLRALRAAAGDPMAPPPEWAIDHLLATGALLRAPCVACGADSERVLWFEVECERARAPEADAVVWPLLLVSWAFFPIALLRRRRRALRAHEIGRDLIYVVPVPVCGACGAGTLDERATTGLLRLVPEYRGLLAKYPRARVRGVESQSQ